MHDEPATGSIHEAPIPSLGTARPVAIRIHDLPASERPREKLLQRGPGSLTEPELMALLFGTGAQGLNVIDMSRELLAKYGTLTALSRCSVDELIKQKGVGKAKAIHLAAVFELGKRLADEQFKDEPLDTPDVLYDFLWPSMRLLSKESLRVVLLTTKFTLLAVEEIHLGSVNETMAHPRDILRPAIVRGAFAIIVVHNHPSGDPTPSGADREFTKRIRDAADLMQVRLVDHLIIGQKGPRHPTGYFSFKETGIL